MLPRWGRSPVMISQSTTPKLKMSTCVDQGATLHHKAILIDPAQRSQGPRLMHASMIDTAHVILRTFSVHRPFSSTSGAAQAKVPAVNPDILNLSGMQVKMVLATPETAASAMQQVCL